LGESQGQIYIYHAKEASIRKTVTRKINNRQTVRQHWGKQMRQLGMAGHLLLRSN